MDERVITSETHTSMRLIKSEDLNHHGTLFAGRTSEWFIESGFIAASALLDPKNIVCLNLHGMYFAKPARSGDVLKFYSRIVYTGKTSLTAHVHVVKNGEEAHLVEGFVTFIHVDENTRPALHHITIKTVTEEDRILFEAAKELRNR